MPDNSDYPDPVATMLVMNHVLRHDYDPRLSELGTLGQIAASIGITDQALYNLRIRYPHDFPEPMAKVGKALLFLAWEVESFHVEYGRGYGKRFEGRGEVLSGRKRRVKA